jgi:hypothetical protein
MHISESQLRRRNSMLFGESHFSDEQAAETKINLFIEQKKIFEMR